MLTRVLVVFFFSSRRRHTRLQGDWSSDVCSSDLANRASRTSCSAGSRAWRRAGRRSRCPRWGLAPYLSGDVDAKLELRDFLLLGEVVAVVGARKPALRAEGEVLHRHVPGRRVDAALEVVLFLELRKLGADQPEHHFLAFWHETQRLEAGRAPGVAIQEKAGDAGTRGKARWGEIAGG